jgi:predicted enzyme related to lactoylglutathione lyase
MQTMTSYAPGNFCWFELVTSDQNAAKDFYAKVFGWKAEDSPMGPDAFYTILNVDGKNVGALYGMDPEQKKRGVPPHWNLYISVASADDMTKKAESLGAKIIMAPFDVMDFGRMSVIQDPTGGMFCTWEAKKHTGAGLYGEIGTFCWTELYTNDPNKAKDFYTKLFGWEIGGDPNYTEWKNAGKSIGGMMKIQKEWGEVPPHWMSYVLVKNCDETSAKITSLGGKLYVGPQDIENVGRFAVGDDPQGAGFAIYEMKTK